MSRWFLTLQQGHLVTTHQPADQFADFVLTANSRVAYTAAVDVAENPGAETFVTRLIDAIRLDEVGAFHRSMAAGDALLLDDLPDTFDKQHTREGIFGTLEELLTHGVQVVTASEMPPAEIKIIERRSRPLFERALIAEIGYPDGPARFEIARRSAVMRGVALSDDALRFLANGLTGNPREIQSSIARIAAESALSGKALDMTQLARAVSRSHGAMLPPSV
jgi:chromosomal replication initiator protein